MKLPEILQQSNDAVVTQQHSEEQLAPFIESLRVIWTKLLDVNQSSQSCTNISSTNANPDEIDFWDYIPSSVVPTSESAITSVFYSVTWILILVELGKRFPKNQAYNQLITAHCDVILRVAICVERFQDGCSLIRMVFPLKLIMLSSSNLSQKESATHRLELWRAKKGLGGIWNVASMAENDISDTYRAYTNPWICL